MCKFKRGEIVKVTNYPDIIPFEDWEEAIFLTKIEGTFHPYVCVADGYEDAFQKGALFTTMGWKYCQKKRPDLKVDDPLIVWQNKDDRDYKSRQHFKEWDEYRVVCWSDGRTSWSAWGDWDCTVWDNYEIPRKEK